MSCSSEAEAQHEFRHQVQMMMERAWWVCVIPGIGTALIVYSAFTKLNALGP